MSLSRARSAFSLLLKVLPAHARSKGVDAALGDREDATEQVDSDHKRTTTARDTRSASPDKIAELELALLRAPAALVCRPRGRGASLLPLPEHAAILLGFERLPPTGPGAPCSRPRPAQHPCAGRVLIALCVSLRPQRVAAAISAAALATASLFAPAFGTTLGAAIVATLGAAIVATSTAAGAATSFAATTLAAVASASLRVPPPSAWPAASCGAAGRRTLLPELRRRWDLCAGMLRLGVGGSEAESSTTRARVQFTAATLSEPRARAECVCDAEA